MDPKAPAEEISKESEKMCVSHADNKAKGWFLTYPQCPCPKEDCLADLRDGLMEKRKLTIEEYVIAEEKHESGDPHLHAFIKLDKRIRFNKTLFDIIYEGKTYHGHYEVAKSWRAVERYCKKEGDFISNFDVKAAQNKQAKKIGVKELESDPLELLEKGVINGFQLVNFVKNQNMYKLLKQKRKADEEINLDIEKKRHFWIYGESNSGKTYYVRKLIKENPNDWFQIPLNNDWAGYNNEKNLYLDEFKGQLTIQELNRICDGGAKVNVKGSSTQLKQDVVVYICSNYNIKECYKKSEEIILESLYNRFNEKLAVRKEESDGKITFEML